MNKEDTKQIILDRALELFAEKGYESVSVGDIAAAVGIKAPSLYNHYKSKQAIFEAIVNSVAEKYQSDTNKINIHVENSPKDVPIFKQITVEDLYAKVCEMFIYSLRDEKISRFRKMMTIEQFRSPQLAELYSARYVDRMVAYHADIFCGLIAAGEIVNEDPQTLALIYVSPLIVLLGVCDRQPEREEECLKKLELHVKSFYKTYNTGAQKQ